MKRVHQENVETYEVTATEIALALGLYLEEGDTITLTRVAGDDYKLKVAGHYDEDTEMPTPFVIPAGVALGGFGEVVDAEGNQTSPPLIPIVMIPPDTSGLAATPPDSDVEPETI